MNKSAQEGKRATYQEMFSTLVRLLKYTKGSRPLYVTGMVLASCKHLIRTVALSMGAMAILEAAQSGSASDTVRTILQIFVLLLVLVTLYAIGALWLDDGVARTSSTVRKTVMKHLVQISASWFDSHHSGDIMARILTDFNDGMQNALNIPIQNTIALLLNGISSISILFALDWHIGLAILGISMLSIALTSLFVRPGRNASAAIRRGNGKVTEDIANLLGAANLIKAHGLYSYVQQKLRASVQASENQHVQYGRLLACNQLLGNGVRLLVFLSVVAIGNFGIRFGWITAAQWIAILQLSFGPIELFMKIGSTFLSLQNALTGTRRVFDMLDVPLERPLEGESHTPRAPTTEAIRAEIPSFRYENTDKEILRNVHLTVTPGEKVALIGKSGGGKSTLLKVLAGLYTPEGEVALFGSSVREMPRMEIHSRIAYLPQSPHLFIGTIEENIALGRPDATREEVVAAAKKAGAEEFIRNLEGGYEYRIAQNAKNLSGGQAQRIALARAYLATPEILLLDEPTSALDLATEAEIIQELAKLRGHTLILSTHRPAVLKFVDRVVNIG